MNRRTHRFQAGLLAAFLAATLQFVLWAGVLSGSVGRAAPPGIASIDADCSSGSATGHHHGPGTSCLLCPVCLALSLPGTLPGPVPAPLPPSLAGRAPLPEAVLPVAAPLLAVASAYPRGPPVA
jgi:hypothetical protein